MQFEAPFRPAAYRGHGHAEPVLRLNRLERAFIQGDREIRVLRGASAEIYPGEIVGLVGPSGAGKSSFLHIVGLLERPDAGEIILGGRSCGQMTDAQRTAVRRQDLGFVYQFHQLLPEFTALENVIIPQLIGGAKRRAAEARAQSLLASLGLANRGHHRPAELSGGEQQRVAIARGIANNPRILLADEPTGNLDPQTADRVFDSLMALVRETGLAAIIATHNYDLAARMDRVLRLQDGLLVDARAG